jgi:hypothetical protein
MNDYISRQDAIEAVRQAVNRGYGTDYGVIDSGVVYEVLDGVEPADVAKVCRCKNCRKCSYDPLFNYYWCNLTLGTRRVKPDDFCSYGEREE